jgi:arylsulfatase A-like enzyme
MLFDNAYSMPQCTPSRVALMTGQYPWRNGWINHYDVPRWGHGAHFDPEEYPSVARIMKNAGYVTCAAGKWQVNDFRLDPEVMVKHGFDEYCMWTGAEGGNLPVSQNRYWDPYIHTKEGSRIYPGQFGEDVFSDFIIDFMTRHKEEPMMIYYPMCLPHGPLTTTPLEPDITKNMDKHTAMVRYADHILKKLLKAMESLGIRNETIVFWTTDNGTSGAITGRRNKRPVRGGKTFLSENGINAPFIVNCPGIVPEGVVSEALVDFSDILPTFAALGGGILPEGHRIDGHSFAEVILGKSKRSSRDWILGMGSHPAMIRNGRVVPTFKFRDRAVRDEKYKAYIDTCKQISALFNLENDPWEEHNLIQEDNRELKSAKRTFKRFLNHFPDVDASPRYTPLEGSVYNIEEEELNRKALQGKMRPNRLPGQEQTRPNVILCMADDLGWGDVGYNGNTMIHTPNLDEMAASGIQFNRFYSGSAVCSPTRGSCLTGRHPYRYGIYHANTGHLKEEEIALPEVLNELGYATGHFGKWHLGTMTPDYSGKGLKRHPELNYMTPGMAGNEEWFATEYAVATYDPYNPENRHDNVGDPRTLYWHNGVNITEGLQGCDSKIIMDKAIPFIRRSVKENRPFLAVIWFHAPHAPVVGHPEYMEKLYSEYSEDEQHYYSVVTALDAQVGRLRKELRELGISENTLLCFTSDNGPEGNPGKKARYQGSAGIFRGRKRSLYEGGVRVPGIIEYPARFTKHREVDLPCSTSDYFPTLCELMGLEIKDYERPFDGISLWDIMEGEQTEREHPIGFQIGEQKSLTDDRYKLVHNLGTERYRSDNGSVPVAEYELYDLVNDPAETENIIARQPDVAEQMIRQLKEWIISCRKSDQGADYR